MEILMRYRLALGFLIAVASSLGKNPLANFAVHHYTRLEVSAKGVEVTYVLFLGEVPTYVLLRDWKLNTKSSQADLERLAAEQTQTWAKNLEFRSGGAPVEPRFERAAIQLYTYRKAEGQAEARIASTFELPGIKSPLQFEDHNFPDRGGWKEIVIGSKAGVQIVTASHDSTDESRALTDTPTFDVVPRKTGNDLRASVDWRASSSQAVPARIVPIPQPEPVPPPDVERPPPPSLGGAAKGDFLSRLLAMSQIGWQWMLLGLAVAFGLGGVHALEPGHGKTIVAAYLVGSRGSMGHAALLGAVVTFTHTISVFLLGMAMLVLSRSVVPGNVIKTLEAASGMAIVAIGAMLFVERLRQFRSNRQHHSHSLLPDEEVTLGSLIALGVSGGLVPCPAALVIMLAAISFGHVGAGLVLMVAFSLGLALVLMAVGMMVLYAKSWLPNPDAATRHPVLRLTPVLSAVVIICLGLLMTGVSLGLVHPGFPV
jgi:ABC-type nickel/cobalt efflux system permease component RcnA